MPKIIDISVPIEKGMAVWPNGAGPRFKRSASDLWVETEITIGLHTGTHIDAPLHRIKGGASIENLKIETIKEDSPFGRLKFIRRKTGNLSINLSAH